MRWSKFQPDRSVRLFLCLYLVAFGIGATAASQMWKMESFQSYVSVYGILERHRIEAIDTKKYMLYLLKEKGIFAGSCMIAGVAGAGEIFALLISLWFGFLGGVIATIFLLISGMKGFFICITGIVSQLLFYIPASILFLVIMGRMTQHMHGIGMLTAQEIRNYILLFLGYLLVMGFGIMVDSYVNSKMWLEIFF